MSSQKKDYQSSTPADYSSVRLKVESQNVGFDVADDKITLTSTNEYEANSNQNLSSVLSQIQDDGPANMNADKPDNLVNFKSNNKKPFIERHQENPKQEKYSSSELSKELEQIKNATVQMSLASEKNTKWLQSLLFVIVLFSLVYYYFDLGERTAQLEASVRIQESNIKDSLAFYNKELTPGIESINKILLGVKQKLGQHDSKNLPLNKTMVDAVNHPSTDKTNQNNDKVNNLKNKIVNLESELAAANKIIIAINKNTMAFEELSKKVTIAELVEKPNEVIVVTNNDVFSGWVVNLASFVDKSRADTVKDTISSSDLTPFIETASVNGDQVFRLVVSGFEERSEAEVFVGMAAKKYDLHGGWVRFINRH